MFWAKRWDEGEVRGGFTHRLRQRVEVISLLKRSVLDRRRFGRGGYWATVLCHCRFSWRVFFEKSQSSSHSVVHRGTTGRSRHGCRLKTSSGSKRKSHTEKEKVKFGPTLVYTSATLEGRCHTTETLESIRVFTASCSAVTQFSRHGVTPELRARPERHFPLFSFLCPFHSSYLTVGSSVGPSADATHLYCCMWNPVPPWAAVHIICMTSHR